MKPSDTILNLAITRGSLSKKLEFIRKVENWIYKDSQNGLFVRITEPSHRTKDQINSELDWMFYLQEQGINFAHPVKSDEGKFVEEIFDKDSFFLASVFHEAIGSPLVEKEDFTENRMRKWGNLLGQLHQKTLNYQARNERVSRPQWNEEKNYIYIKSLCTEPQDFFHQFLVLEKWLNSLSTHRDIYGLIHADVHHGNFFVDEQDNITVFDFDDCHYHWFAYDLAVPLFTLAISMRNKCNEDEIAKMRYHFLKGYKESGTPTQGSLLMVDHFILYRHFVIYFWEKKNLTNIVLSKKAEEWMSMAVDYCHDYISKFKVETLELSAGKKR